jgi:hypothetical protein
MIFGPGRACAAFNRVELTRSIIALFFIGGGRLAEGVEYKFLVE